MKGMILAPLQEVARSQVFEVYPPHITIVPKIDFPDSKLDALIERLHGVAEDWLPMMLTVCDEKLYDGDDRKISVKELRGKAFGVHIGAVMAIKALGGTFPEFYTGINGWSPHVSNSDELVSGDKVALSSFALMQSFGSRKVVLEVFNGLNI